MATTQLDFVNDPNYIWEYSPLTQDETHLTYREPIVLGTLPPHTMPGVCVITIPYNNFYYEVTAEAYRATIEHIRKMPLSEAVSEITNCNEVYKPFYERKLQGRDLHTGDKL